MASRTADVVFNQLLVQGLCFERSTEIFEVLHKRTIKYIYIYLIQTVLNTHTHTNSIQNLKDKFNYNFTKVEDITKIMNLFFLIFTYLFGCIKS